MSDLFSKAWLQLPPEERKRELTHYMGGLTPTVVAIDDEFPFLIIIKDKLETLGFDVFGTSKPEEAYKFIQEHKSALSIIFSDVQMPEKDGFSVRKDILNFAPQVPFILMSGFVNRETALKGVELRINDFLSKPFKDENLIQILIKDVVPRLTSIREERELLKGFTDDASNLIEQIEDLVLGFEEDPHNAEALSKVFGMVHTIKGSSGFFEPRTLHTYAHRLEDTLKAVQAGQLKLNSQVVSVWLQACDVLKTFIEEFKSSHHKTYDIKELTAIFDLSTLAGESQLQESTSSTSNSSSKGNPTQGAPEGAPATIKSKSSQELKVSVALLDEFMQISGEMTVIRNMINKIIRGIEKQYPSDKDVALLSELFDELHKINSAVQGKITEIRKVPVRSVIKPLNRIVRDTAQSLHKEIELHVKGDEIRIDNSVAEALSNSLVHLIRNSMDHGVELPDERESVGKPRKGDITINTHINGEIIVVDIIDDGKGINPEAIRKKLISNGTYTPEQISRMSITELNHMIFSSGFSTAAQITDISGRGVGMSMVKDVIEAIGGKILIDSTVGKGTQFSLQIPIPKSVLITNCLFVTSKQMQFGLPQDQVQRVLAVENALSKDLIRRIEGAFVLQTEDALLPIISLCSVLNGTPTECPSELNSGYLVLLTCSQQSLSFCLWVDSVLDVEDTVVKAISAGPIKSLNLYLGATFLGDGGVGLILNIEGIAQKSKIGRAHPTKFHSLQENKPIAEKDLESGQTMDIILCEINGSQLIGIDQKRLYRLEEFDTQKAHSTGSFMGIPYRNTILTLIDLGQFLLQKWPLTPPDLSTRERLNTLVIETPHGFIGFVVDSVLDLVQTQRRPEMGVQKQIGCEGWLLLNENSILLIDVEGIVQHLTRPQGAPTMESKLPAIDKAI